MGSRIRDLRKVELPGIFREGRDYDERPEGSDVFKPPSARLGPFLRVGLSVTLEMCVLQGV